MVHMSFADQHIFDEGRRTVARLGESEHHEFE
jgi:hypothetical protein